MTIVGVPISVHELRRTLAVWRPDTMEDGAGGQDVVMVEVGEVQVQVSQPSAAERISAAQAGAEMTHVMHARPDAQVYRGDELRGGGDTFYVIATVQPSQPVYLRIEAKRIQAEPAEEGS